MLEYWLALAGICPDCRNYTAWRASTVVNENLTFLEVGCFQAQIFAYPTNVEIKLEDTSGQR